MYPKEGVGVVFDICLFLLGEEFNMINKTRQDNVLFGVLYSPMYIDFIQII